MKIFNRQNYNTTENYDAYNEISFDDIPSKLHKRISYYEDYTKYNLNYVDTNVPYIVKLELRTKHLKSITDDEKVKYNNMVQELMKEFHAQTAVILDNVILLVFSNNTKYENELFRGNHNKINTIIASFASSSLSLKINKACSFFSHVVQFPKELNYDMITYIRTYYNKMKIKNIVPIFIKRTINNETHLPNKYKHIKFTLNKIKTNDIYYKLFNTPTYIKEEFKYIDLLNFD